MDLSEPRKQRRVTCLEKVVEHRTLERESELQMGELRSRRLSEGGDLLANGLGVAIADNWDRDHRRERQDKKRQRDLRDPIRLRSYSAGLSRRLRRVDD
jgi:hypothetical protein